MESDDTILTVKETIWEHEGIPVEQQKLYFSGKYLENNQTVKNFKVEEGNTLHLLVRLIEGMHIFVLTIAELSPWKLSLSTRLEALSLKLRKEKDYHY